MRRFLTFCSLLPSLAVFCAAATPRPVNDGTSSTLLLAERVGSYTGQGGNGATAEKGETNVGGALAEHTVWYRYQAPTAGRFIVDIKDEQGLRAELRFPGNPPATIPLQTFADGTSNTIAFDEERLSADLTRGQVIYLVVDAEKPFDFSWRFVEVVNDTYKDAETIVGPAGTVKRSDKGATLSPYEESLGFSAPAIWFQWTAPDTGNYFLELLGSREAASQLYGKFFVSIYESNNGEPGTLRGSIGGNGLGIGTTLPINVTAGTVYYIACRGFATVPDNQIWLSWYKQGTSPVLEWANAEAHVSENDGTAKAILLLQYRGFAAAPVSVNVSGIPGGPYASATGGVDYAASNIPVSFTGSDHYKVVEIPILPDSEQEAPESFGLGLNSPSGASIRDGTSNTILIGGEESVGACGFVVREAAVREGQSAWLEVRRLSPDDKQIVIGWKAEAVNGAVAGVDFAAISGTATIASDQTSTFIEIPTYQDGAFEGREYFSVQLSRSPVSGSITDGTSNTIVVVEDDDYFVPRAGRYCGLVPLDSWGALVKCALTNAGTATGTVEYQGVKYPFRGVFNADGELVVPLQRGNRPPLGLRLQFGEGWNACGVSVRDPDGTWADGTARWLPYDGKRTIAPQAGRYTVLCESSVAAVPFALAATAKADGSVRFLGRMADNTPVAFSGNVALGDGSVRGECAFAAPLYNRTGTLYGTFELGLGPEQPGGECAQWWHKPWRQSDVIYPALPVQTCLSMAFPYTPPARGERVTGAFEASLGDGSVRFVGNGILDGTSNTLQISERNQVTFPANPNACSIKIDPKTGFFTGRITPPGESTATFYGVFVEGADGEGVGFYVGGQETGAVAIQAVN